MARPKARPPPRRLADRLHHRRKRVPQNHRPPAPKAIQVPVPIRIPQVRPLRPRHKRRIAPHRTKRPHRRVHPTRAATPPPAPATPSTLVITRIVSSLERQPQTAFTPPARKIEPELCPPGHDTSPVAGRTIYRRKASNQVRWKPQWSPRPNPHPLPSRRNRSSTARSAACGCRTAHSPARSVAQSSTPRICATSLSPPPRRRTPRSGRRRAKPGGGRCMAAARHQATRRRRSADRAHRYQAARARKRAGPSGRGASGRWRPSCSSSPNSRPSSLS